LSNIRTKKPPLRAPHSIAIQKPFEQALLLHHQGRLIEAEYLAKEVHRQNPKHFDTLHLLGVIALQTDRTERGIDLIKRAIRIDQNVAAAFNNLGIGLAKLKRLEEALVNFDKAIEIDSKHAETHKNRGNILRDMKRPDEARASYDRAARLRAEAATQAKFQQALVSCRQGRFADAETLCEEMLHSTPEYFDVLHLLGTIALQTQRVERSIELLEKAIEVNPNAPEAYNNLGIALTTATLFEKALANYDTAIALRPDYAEAHFNRGVLLQKVNRLQDALTSYDMATALKPLYAEAHNNRGNVLVDLMRFDEAVVSYDSAISAAPDFSEAYNNRGFALKSLFRLEQALESFSKAIAVKPDNFDAHVNRGYALLGLKRYDEALAAYDKSLAIKFDLVAAWLGRGYLFDEVKRHDDAIVAFDRALALQPGLADAWLGRARSQCRLGRLNEGIKDYQQALTLGGNPDLIRYELAQFGAEEIPISMPKNLVVSLFDNYAGHFDAHLLNELKYHTPIDILNSIKSVCFSNALEILDLGCGTGLVGAQLRQIARILSGVDLSSRMLKKAEQRGIYDDLTCSEIIEFLLGNVRKYDLVVAADVFIYFGDLTEAFQLVRRALRDDGIFCFSVEAVEKMDFTLQKTGRYAHSRDYLQNLARNSGFIVESINASILRNETESDIWGYISVMRCA
jgi:predicted TPR repeat methyltransferase